MKTEQPKWQKKLHMNPGQEAQEKRSLGVDIALSKLKEAHGFRLNSLSKPAKGVPSIEIAEFHHPEFWKS